MNIRIEKFRKEKGLTQGALAMQLGVKQGAVAMWETGKALPRADKLPKLAEILDCTVDELLKR